MFRTETLDGVSYNDIVPQDYRLNPETDDLVYGDRLRDGMTVLVESNYRVDNNTYSHYLSVTNRWCVVTKLRIETGAVYFIGVYADGQKVVRFSEPTRGWLVKLHTKPED